MELLGRRNNVRPQMRFIIQCDNKVHKKTNKKTKNKSAYLSGFLLLSMWSGSDGKIVFCVLLDTEEVSCL